MKRSADLERRLRSLEALGEAVGAMKSLSAHHLRESRGAVAPARAYREGVERILASTGASIPRGNGPCGMLVIGAELGLCGGYNSRMVAAATEHRHGLGAGPTLCVGHRASMLLARQGIEVARTFGAPTSTRGVPALLLQLAEEALDTYVGHGLSRLDVVSSRFGGVGVETAVVAQLLPFPPASPDQKASNGRVPRARYVGSEHLASVAAREFLYIALYDVLLDALASEHGARLVATQSAESWLDERTSGLRRHLAAARREASTQEMIEIVAGARAR
jgi:F-type H+-transporting ATPase subunit gamma